MDNPSLVSERKGNFSMIYLLSFNGDLEVLKVPNESSLKYAERERDIYSEIKDGKFIVKMEFPENRNQLAAKMPFYPNIDINYFFSEKEKGINRYLLRFPKHNRERELCKIKTKFAYQTASAIAYLHSKNICSSDIKPSNLLLDGNLDVYLSDFNVSGRFGEKQIGFSMPYSESISTEQILDPELDIYAFGILLYYIFDPYNPELKCEEIIFKMKNNKKFKEEAPTIYDLAERATDKNRKSRPKMNDIMMKFKKRECFFGNFNDLEYNIRVIE